MLVLKKKVKRFSIGGGIARLNRELSRLPTDTECFKFISDGSFSTICFILAVCLKTRVKSLHVSTFAIGKKEILALKALSDKGRIDYVYFLFQKRLMDYKNGYTELFEKVLSEKKWEYGDSLNHSKVLIFDTDDGKFVLETSSNLNENPRVEQFSFEKDELLYDFYMRNLFCKS